MTDQADDILRDLGVSRETKERLVLLVSMLKKWNPAINLVSRASLDDAWTRHILDSAQLHGLTSTATHHWADLGSGGGCPGLVIAIIAAELRPTMRLTLVESDQRKAEFLRHACRSLGLRPRVDVNRIESVAPLGADLVSARALAPLDTLLGYAHRHLATGGIALFPKGKNHLGEIENAKRNWRFALEVLPSRTDSAAAILQVKDLSHA